MSKKFQSVRPEDVPTAKFHGYLLGAVAPRPIALASTIDAQGNVNVSPFSFYNAFSANPPIVIFSPARRVRDNTIKHTLENVMEVPEVVISAVTYDIVQQVSLSSTEYDKGVNEFQKAGFTSVASSLVRPPRVGESPVSFECKVKDIIHLGTEGGAGNLVVCEVVMVHLREDILDNQGNIDTPAIDLVSRMGGNWYNRAHGASLFEVEKPITKKGIGMDMLPVSIRTSRVLTGNHLARLANIESIPHASQLKEIDMSVLLERFKTAKEAHQLAARLLDDERVLEAWAVLLSVS